MRVVIYEMDSYFVQMLHPETLQKYLALFLCFIGSLHMQAQTAAGIVSPAPPEPVNYRPVNTGTRTVNAPPVNKGDFKPLQAKLSPTEPDLINQEITKYKQRALRPPVARRVDTSQYQKDLATFNEALAQLKALLSGTANPSLADAFYITESAWGNPYLSRKEYDQALDRSADFIRKWMQQNGLDAASNEDKHRAIQKFMSQKLTISEDSRNKDGKTRLRTVEHQPFFYDFEDYEARNDHRNFFVTKCLATGGGQCNSMPVVYLLLAERLGVPAYLSFAPQHALVKYRNNKDEIVNYEATTNWHINNLWYQENLFISPDAIRSGIYLDTLNKQKIIANCMLDLAIQYCRKMPNDNGKFLQDCLWESHFYFPKQNNIYAYFVYSMLLKGWLSAYIAAHHITDPEQLRNDTWAFGLQKEYQRNEGYIKELGYRDLPETLYNDIMQEAALKLERQEQHGLSGKTKRNLFITAD